MALLAHNGLRRLRPCDRLTLAPVRGAPVRSEDWRGWGHAAGRDLDLRNSPDGGLFKRPGFSQPWTFLDGEWA